MLSDLACRQDRQGPSGMPPWIREKGSFVVVDFLMRKASGISSHSLTEKKRKGEKNPPTTKKTDLLLFCWEIGNSCHGNHSWLIPTVRNRRCSVASFNFHVSNKTGDPLYYIRLAFIKRFKINNYKRISYKLPTTLWHRLLNYQRVGAGVCMCVLVRVHVPLFPVGEEVIKL